MFHADHVPVAIVRVNGCKGHVFGYQCLRQNLSAGTPGSNKCPMCRTTWFENSSGEIARVAKEWTEIGQAEGMALQDGLVGLDEGGGV